VAIKAEDESDYAIRSLEVPTGPAGDPKPPVQLCTFSVSGKPVTNTLTDALKRPQRRVWLMHYGHRMSVDLPKLRSRLSDSVDWVGDRYDDASFMNIDAWFREPEILSALGPALSALFADDAPTVIVGPSASGYLLGPIVADVLGIGFVRVSKEPGSNVNSDHWRSKTTPPDYADRHLALGWREGLVKSSDRVLCVDDVVATGGQITAIRGVVNDIGASWVGAAVLVDSLSDSQVRRDLRIRALAHMRDL